MRSVFTVMLLAVAAVPAQAGIDLDRRLFSEPALGLEVSLPDGWKASTQTGYPGLLLLLQSAGRQSRILLGVGELGSGKSLDRFAAENAAALRALGMVVSRSQRTLVQGRVIWDLAALFGRGLALRQLWFSEGRQVFTLTLAGPVPEVSRFQADLQELLAGITIRATPGAPRDRLPTSAPQVKTD